MRTGQKVAISVDTYPGVTWKGTVASIAPASGSSFSLLPAQNTTGNWVKVVQRIPMIISIDDTQGKPPLRVGMSVVVGVDTGHARGLPDFVSNLLGHSRGRPAEGDPFRLRNADAEYDGGGVFALPHRLDLARDVAPLRVVVATTEGDVSRHLLHLVLLHVRDGFGVGLGHTEHELPADEVGFDAHHDLGPFRLSDPHHLRDGLLGNIEGVDEDPVIRAEIAGVRAKKFRQPSDARVEHVWKGTSGQAAEVPWGKSFSKTFSAPPLRPFPFFSRWLASNFGSIRPAEKQGGGPDEHTSLHDRHG